MTEFVRSDEPKVNQCQIKSKAQMKCPAIGGIRYDKNVILKSFRNHILNFDIPLTFGL